MSLELDTSLGGDLKEAASPLVAHQRSSGAPHRGPLSEAWRTRFAEVVFFAF